MANKINGFVDSGSEYLVGKIIVSDASAGGIGLGVVPLEIAVADEIRAIPGVALSTPRSRSRTTTPGVPGFGMPKIIVGRVAGARRGPP